MKYIDEYRDKEKVAKVAEAIKKVAGKEPVTLMEVCGTHTMAIFRCGIKDLLPENIRLISGPGCPVCVSPNSFIDTAVAYARQKDVIVCTFGDMFRVPGSSSNLEKERAAGGDIRVVDSPMSALELAVSRPDKKVVFLGVGFETTTPAVAITIQEAQKGGVKNFYCLCGHKIIPPALEVLLKSPESKIDGFILPGHVSVVLGSRSYEFMAEEFKSRGVVAGFEPLDILEAVYMLMLQVRDGRSAIEIQYKRIVRP